ncbi:hypothetical protein Glove_9g259 [Diversispora epigaea]|uniref:BTB domain-containing protein n=1 Tax=Diversispora epigaea TaxID=1348612 RepID=A0A397JZP0_9GLOM|nr:hypothetical protein Glove_9g259 [Diversispora epigaea]
MIKPNIASRIFEFILKYIYGGIVNVESVDTKTIYELMITVYELEFEELSKKLESYLIEAKASWFRTHFHSFIDFASLQELALISILKNDDLQMGEGKNEQLWDDLIQYLILSGEPIKTIILPARSILISTTLPSRENKSFSTIINDEHELIANRLYILYKTYEILGGYNPLEWDKYTKEISNFSQDSYCWCSNKDRHYEELQIL